MDDFITIWKAEHEAIEKALAEAPKLDLTSARGKEKLLATKEILLKHLKSEDNHLYPILKQHAEENMDLKKILDTFANDMSSITKIVLSFFKKYEKDSSSKDIAADFGKMVAALKSRISREENILMKEYLKVTLTP